MLKTLDPHSSFFDPRSYAQMRERQAGQLLRSRHHDSGHRRRHHRDVDLRGLARLQAGACAAATSIARIEGEDAKGWTTEQAVTKLKGPKGTSVNISLARRGYDDLIDWTSSATR